jgi:hypothetical protein
LVRSISLHEKDDAGLGTAPLNSKHQY